MSRFQPGDIIEITEIMPPVKIQLKASGGCMVGDRGEVRCRDRRGKPRGYGECWEVYPIDRRRDHIPWWCIADSEMTVKLVERPSIEELLTHRWKECRDHGLRLYRRERSLFYRLFDWMRRCVS